MKFSLDQQLNSWEERNELVNLLAESSNYNSERERLRKIINQKIISETDYKSAQAAVEKEYEKKAKNKVVNRFIKICVIAAIIYILIPIAYTLLMPEIGWGTTVLYLVLCSFILGISIFVGGAFSGVITFDKDDGISEVEAGISNIIFVIVLSVIGFFIFKGWAYKCGYMSLICLFLSDIMSVIVIIVSLIVNEEYFIKKYKNSDEYALDMIKAKEKDKKNYEPVKLAILFEIEDAKEALKKLDTAHNENYEIYQEFERHILDIGKSEELLDEGRMAALRLIAAFPKRLGTPRDLMEEASLEAYKKMWNDHEIRCAEAEAAMASAQAALEEFGRTFNRK